MSNPTRAQILNAHEALEELKNVALSAADSCGDTENYLAWKSEIIAALPPLPRPTMAEVEWDDNKHYLAEAENPRYGRVIMVTPVDADLIEVLVPNLYPTKTGCSKPEDLTPTGKRYTLTEVQE